LSDPEIICGYILLRLYFWHSLLPWNPFPVLCSRIEEMTWMRAYNKLFANCTFALGWEFLWRDWRCYAWRQVEKGKPISWHPFSKNWCRSRFCHDQDASNPFTDTKEGQFSIDTYLLWGKTMRISWSFVSERAFTLQESSTEIKLYLSEFFRCRESCLQCQGTSIYNTTGKNLHLAIILIHKDIHSKNKEDIIFSGRLNCDPIRLFTAFKCMFFTQLMYEMCPLICSLL